MPVSLPPLAAMQALPQLNPTRLRSYVLRLPFCTRILVAAILGLWIATIPFPWIREFGRLEPAKMDLTQSRWLRFSFTGSEWSDGPYGTIDLESVPKIGSVQVYTIGRMKNTRIGPYACSIMEFDI